MSRTFSVGSAASHVGAGRVGAGENVTGRTQLKETASRIARAGE